MAVGITSLSSFSLEKQEEVLEGFARDYIENMITLENAEKEKWTHIEIDGETFRIHPKVNDLLNSVYKMYEQELKKKN